MALCDPLDDKKEKVLLLIEVKATFEGNFPKFEVLDNMIEEGIAYVLKRKYRIVPIGIVVNMGYLPRSIRESRRWFFIYHPRGNSRTNEIKKSLQKEFKGFLQRLLNG